MNQLAQTRFKMQATCWLPRLTRSLVTTARRTAGLTTRSIPSCSTSQRLVSSSSSSSGDSTTTTTTTSATTTTTKFRLPDPTWSVQDLQLSQQHAPVSEQELATLARRALIDLDALDGATKTQLRHDLGNMMHMIQTLEQFPLKVEIVDEVALYDVPRGVSTAPLRDDQKDASTTSQKEEASSDDTKMAQKVFDSFLKPQTTRVGAHYYFSIETKREDTDK